MSSDPTLSRWCTLVGLTVVLAACASPPDAPAATGPTPAAPAADAATVQGLVVDDESLPLADSNVTLRPAAGSARSTLTDKAGRFQFVGVEPATYTVEASADGFLVARRTLTVSLPPIEEVRLMLTPIVSTQSFVETLPHVHYYEASVAGVAALPCQGCDWAFKTLGPATSLVLELRGGHAAPKPLPAVEYVYLHSPPDQRTLFYQPKAPIPLHHVLSSDHIKGSFEFRLRTSCDSEWVCYQEKREVRVSAFHNLPVPEGYSGFE